MRDINLPMNFFFVKIKQQKEMGGIKISSYKFMEKQNYVRPSWDDYFMSIVDMVGSRGTCDRGRIGCIITRDNKIVVTGYVGSPSGIAHCDEVGHEMHTVTHADGHETRHCIRTTHAEQNAICQAAKSGVSLDGGTLYIKMTPCYVCAKMLISSGIKRVVCEKDYHGGSRSKEIFAEAGVRYNLLNPEMVTYADMTPGEAPELQKAVPVGRQEEVEPISSEEESTNEPTIEDLPFDEKNF